MGHAATARSARQAGLTRPDTDQGRLVIAISPALGLGVSQVPEFLVNLPTTLRHVMESGVATGGLCALLLNWFLPDTEKPAAAPLTHP